MASTISNSSVVASVSSPLLSSRPVTLPEIPELNNPNFLDVLVPGSPPLMVVEPVGEPQVPVKANPLMDALKATANRTYTANRAQALKSTLSPVLDAFNGLNQYVYGKDIDRYLSASWKEDPQLTLRLIWNLRSIHDGVGEKELFYRAFGWLYDNHPRTAIANLPQLVAPVCVSGKKDAPAKSHGYWKDLLNILALATLDQLSNIKTQSTFLHSPRAEFTFGRNRNKGPKIGTPASRIEANEEASRRAKEVAAITRRQKDSENHTILIAKLKESKFRALYIAVARLFSEQLVKDIQVLFEISALEPGQDPFALVKKISLAGKWAPSPGLSHDRVTNISTAIAELIYASHVFPAYPSSLKTPLSAHERALVLRSFFQRWVLTELRRAGGYPEPLMSAKRWKQIKYTRVSSIAMKNYTPIFFTHDPEGFEKYLTAVEGNKKTISGATLFPHELVAQTLKLANPYVPDAYKKAKEGLVAIKKKLAETQLRVVEAQWKTLIANLRDAGTLENSLAICDVSGSMGSIYSKHFKDDIQPILPAVSLSLVLAALTKEPWNSGIITFSAVPSFIAVDDREQSLVDQVNAVGRSEAGYNTDLQAVFLKLLLPLAVANNVKQEDMVKRLFIFTDMQFDYCDVAHDAAVNWETNYDKIESAYKKAGYEVPQIVYWNLAAGKMTVEVESDRRGVAMMNGFSPAMMKVFMGETEEPEPEEMEWESVVEDGESVTVVEKAEKKKKEEFNPVNVMKKALMRQSYDGLVVLD